LRVTAAALIAAASWAERPGWTIAGDAVDFEGACSVEMTTRLAGWLAVISIKPIT
jgi:hypothetical protein